jgi:hypothetical protein
MRITRLAGRLPKLGRMFCVTTFTSYHDESYSAKRDTLCVGGWLARDSVWDDIERDWKARIDYENRKSAQKGFPAISRYHAADCANLKKEFAENKGWDVDRQIKLSKRLCGIISKHRPYGIVAGGIGSEFATVDQSLTGPERVKAMYAASFRIYLYMVAETMTTNFPDDRVTLFFDRTKDFESIVAAEYKGFREHPRLGYMADSIITVAPLGWEDAIALQPADLLAYEGFKRVGVSMEEGVRKALLAMIGDRTPLAVARCSSGGSVTRSDVQSWCKAAYDRQ